MLSIQNAAQSSEDADAVPVVQFRLPSPKAGKDGVLRYPGGEDVLDDEASSDLKQQLAAALTKLASKEKGVFVCVCV
jgi:hypothetical protein